MMLVPWMVRMMLVILVMVIAMTMGQHTCCRDKQEELAHGVGAS